MNLHSIDIQRVVDIDLRRFVMPKEGRLWVVVAFRSYNSWSYLPTFRVVPANMNSIMSHGNLHWGWGLVVP